MKAAVKCKLLLYADDSALLVSGKDVLEIEEILSVDLGAVNLCQVLAQLDLLSPRAQTNSNFCTETLDH